MYKNHANHSARGDKNDSHNNSENKPIRSEVVKYLNHLLDSTQN